MYFHVTVGHVKEDMEGTIHNCLRGRHTWEAKTGLVYYVILRILTGVKFVSKDTDETNHNQHCYPLGLKSEQKPALGLSVRRYFCRT